MTTLKEAGGGCVCGCGGGGCNSSYNVSRQGGFLEKVIVLKTQFYTKVLKNVNNRLK